MNKHLLTIGFEIPGFSDNCVDINDSFSLMDADVLLVSPESLVPRGDWVNFTAGGGCYDVETSKKYQDIIYHLRKE
ncbi:MAG TPA: hypothetical protein DCO75_13400, partial [Fibrobacteres bacterium]|nr:hypothetical protein [Fibrobacterota bacterium]